jgi:hypothetical protein
MFYLFTTVVSRGFFQEKQSYLLTEGQSIEEKERS